MNFEAKEGFAGLDAAEQKYKTLKMAIGFLPPFDRQVLQLRWADDLSREETATILHRAPASVLAAEHRLRSWMRQQIECAELTLV
ncbi:MAG: sigma-70 family RNA polymerase sigma factor [Phycisphaerales bacterium]|nr:sigma-70 family RNA polymerase sigma factor [Phycisphaerales bacterium]